MKVDVVVVNNFIRSQLTQKQSVVIGNIKEREMWNERYSEPGFAFGTEPNDFLRAVVEKIPAGGNVLCIAEGEGRNAVFSRARL